MGKLSLQRASYSTKPLLMPDSIVGEKYIDVHEIAGFVVKLLCDCTRQDEKRFFSDHDRNSCCKRIDLQKMP